MHKFTRKEFLATAALTSLAPLALQGQTKKQPRKQPNILLYIVDDQGMNDAKCYGNPVIKTPGLNILAENGVKFTKAFCTSASCSASRSVILSGLHNHANGTYGHIHSYNHFSSFNKIKTLPVLLEQAGYRTGRAGKYHVAPEEVFKFQKTFKGHSPKMMAANCKSFIEEKSDKPFFLYFCTHEPHRPFKRDGSDPIKPEDVIVPPYLPDTKECRKELAKYYMSVQRADSGLLELINILKKTGHWEDTVILYASDNGIAFPGAKTNLDEPASRLPFVFRDPTQKKQGGTCNAILNYTCITPTLLDFAGALPKRNKFHGKSFKSIIGEENPKGWDETYMSHTFHEITMYYPMRVLREKRYKLIWNIASGLDYPFASDLYGSSTWKSVKKQGLETYGKRSIKDYLKRPKFELYDLQTDPDEVKNLAYNPAHKKTLERMKTKLKTFQKKTRDPWIVKWSHE